MNKAHAPSAGLRRISRLRVEIAVAPPPLIRFQIGRFEAGPITELLQRMVAHDAAQRIRLSVATAKARHLP